MLVGDYVGKSLNQLILAEIIGQLLFLKCALYISVRQGDGPC